MLWWTLRQLQSSDSNERIRAVEKLGNSKNEQVVDALIAALKDENLDVRKGAAEALGKIGDSRAVGPLAATLQDNTPDLLVAGLGTSRYLGIPDEAHMQMRHMWLFKVRNEAAQALAKIGSSQSIEMLSIALQSNDSDVRLAALGALVGISSPSVDDILLTTLKDEVAAIRAMSASALGGRGNHRFVAPLIEALRDHDSDVRSLAAMALGFIGGPRGLAPLQSVVCEDVDAEVRKMAESAISLLQSKDK